jgi:hypothetical protein
MKLGIAVLSVLLSAASASAFAQTSGQIEQRKDNQQHRIAQGVNSGQLTPRETRNLERREASINREERHMRAADHGHLTRADRAALNRRQNHVSRSINRDKHNARVQH